MTKEQQLQSALNFAVQQRNAANDQLLNFAVMLEVANARIKELEDKYEPKEEKKAQELKVVE